MSTIAEWRAAWEHPDRQGKADHGRETSQHLDSHPGRLTSLDPADLGTGHSDRCPDETLAQATRQPGEPELVASRTQHLIRLARNAGDAAVGCGHGPQHAL